MDSTADQLSRLPLGEKFVYSCGDLVESWRVIGVGAEAVEPVLRFMEEHPDEDFGTPGSLTHFVEQFAGWYEEKLLESLSRRPTIQTMTMLMRIANAAKTATEAERYASLFLQISKHPLIDAQEADVAIEVFLAPLHERIARGRRNQATSTDRS